MKKESACFFIILFLFLQILCFGRPGRAYADDMWTKAGRGAANALLWPGEVYTRIDEMAKTQRWPIAFFGGAAKGAYYGLQRFFVGMYEVATFPLPGSTNYGPIIHPELPFKKWE